MANYDALARGCQRATLASLLGLLIVIAIDTLIAPSNAREPNIVMWLIMSLPLLIFVPGVWRRGIYSYAWLSFVSLLYFAQSVTSLFVPWRRPLDVVHLLLSIALFMCAMMAVRYTARANRAASS